MWKDRIPAKQFLTPPPQPRPWNSSPCSPMQPMEKKKSPVRSDSFHVLHKVPTGDSPYVKAKHVQLIDRDPNKAISLFWSAINSGDRVDSALKDMAIVMKQLNRTDEAIEAIKSFRHYCSHQAQESLDNVLIDLYKRGGRIDEHMQLLQYKLKLIDEGVAFRGKKTKIARSQGKKFHVSIEQERSRLLGNLAWANMQQNNYQTAEELYRKALSIEPDKNKQCNLAICLMHGGRIAEAKSLLQAVRPSSAEREIVDSYVKSFDRAFEMLTKLESQSVLKPNEHEEDIKSQCPSFNGDEHDDFGFSVCGRWEEKNSEEPLLLEDLSNNSVGKWERESYSRSLLLESRADSSGFDKGRVGTETQVEQFSGWQSSRRPLFVVNKWKKGSHSPNTLQKDEGWVIETRNEVPNEGKSIKTDGEPLVSPFPINRNSDSQSSINKDWWRSWGDDEDKKQTVKESSLNPKMLIESPVPDENSGSMEPGKLEPSKLGGCLPSSIDGDWNQMSVITVSGSASDNVGGKNTHRVQDVTGNSNMAQDFSIYRSEKSWADMVEEEEMFLSECMDVTTSKWEYSSQESSVSFQTPSKWDDGFHNENLNSNIISRTPHPPPTSTCSLSRISSHMHPQPQIHTEILQRKFEVVDLKEEENINNTKKCSFRSLSARRSLSFDQEHKDPAGYYCPSPKKDYNSFASIGGGGGKDSKSTRRGRRRLQVFRDITLPDSPGA